MYSTVSVAEQGAHGILLLFKGEIEGKTTHTPLTGPGCLGTLKLFVFPLALACRVTLCQFQTSSSESDYFYGQPSLIFMVLPYRSRQANISGDNPLG